MHVNWTREARNVYRIFVEKHFGKQATCNLQNEMEDGKKNVTETSR
jgi:hypothetical protein